MRPQEDIEIKPVQQVLDDAALLPDELMELAEWIAQYYVAPLGEVLRGMLPLAAEVKRQFVYRIAEAGRRVLYEGAAKGSSRRSKLSAGGAEPRVRGAELSGGWRAGEDAGAAIGHRGE